MDGKGIWGRWFKFREFIMFDKVFFRKCLVECEKK